MYYVHFLFILAFLFVFDLILVVNVYCAKMR